MSNDTADAKFGCPTCGRKFAWKPQIAGKTAKCKCGSAVQVPATSPAPAAHPPAEVDPEQDEFAALAAAAEAESEYAVTQDAGYRCPGCGNSLEAGSVICVHCGFNTKTGKRMKTSSGGGAAQKPAGGTRFPPGGLVKQAANAEGSGAAAMVKPVLIFVVLAAVVGGAVYGFKMLGGGGGGGSASAHPIDQQVASMVSNGGNYELKAWLADNERQQKMVMGMNERQATVYADRLYTLGATRVFSFGGLMTASLGVELPAEPDKRAALFKYQAKWHEDMMAPIQKDEGQKHILLKMRLNK